MLKRLFSFLGENIRWVILTLIWLFAGMYTGPFVYAVLPVCLLLMKRLEMNLGLLLGFFLILTLSDSRQPQFMFAENAKNIYIVMLGLFLFTDLKKFQPFEKVYKRYIVFLILAAIGLMFSPVVATSFQKLISYLLILLVIPNYLARVYRENGDKALYAVGLLGALVLLSGLVLRFLAPEFVSLEGRFSGILGNPNGLGLFCLLFFVLFAVMNEIRPQAFTRTERYIIYAIIILSMVLSGSRNSIFTILLFILFRTFFRLSPLLGFMLVAGIIISYQLILANATSIILSMGLEEYFRLETLETGSGRIVAWDFGWEHITKSPVFGGGIEFTNWLYKQNYQFLSMQGHQGNAHNSFITFWLDTGIIGLLAYIWGTFAVFIKGSARTRSSLPAMYALLFSAFFESWLTASLNPFTIQFVMIMTLITSPAFETVSVPAEETPLPPPQPGKLIPAHLRDI
ncbi:MAG TPA: O-antigen ligase family protein [Bacteroidia bacterium]|nr:O-antigen ligase family protein [Bacteroidia bacterium]